MRRFRASANLSPILLPGPCCCCCCCSREKSRGFFLLDFFFFFAFCRESCRVEEGGGEDRNSTRNIFGRSGNSTRALSSTAAITSEQ